MLHLNFFFGGISVVEGQCHSLVRIPCNVVNALPIVSALSSETAD